MVTTAVSGPRVASTTAPTTTGTNTWKIVRELQPDACMFSDGGPDCRWVGNESGFAGETCWATMNRDDSLPGLADPGYSTGPTRRHRLASGRSRRLVRPAGCTIPREDDAVKSVWHLLKIYYESVGRGCNLNLNVPPVRRGQIPENDAKVLRQRRAILDTTFATRSGPWGEGHRQQYSRRRSAVRPGNTRRRQPRHLLGDRGCGDDRRTGARPWHARYVRVVRLASTFRLDNGSTAWPWTAWDGQEWKEFATATSIGNQRLLRNLRFTSAQGPPSHDERSRLPGDFRNGAVPNARRTC